MDSNSIIIDAYVPLKEEEQDQEKHDEEKQDEEKQDHTQESDVKDIIFLLTEVFRGSEELQLKYFISPKSCEIAEYLLNKRPDVFKSVEEEIIKIAADKKIDITDLPSLILLLKDLLNLNKNDIKNDLKNITIDDLLQFIKDILIILIEKDVIIVDNKEYVNKIIELSIQLLKSNIELSTTVFSLFTSIFSLHCCNAK
jgi:hypothetical protein